MLKPEQNSYKTYKKFVKFGTDHNEQIYLDKYGSKWH